MNDQQKPLVGITMGDPAGIGPEIIAGVWEQRELHELCRPVVYGHPEILRRAAVLRKATLQVVRVVEPEQAQPSPQVLPCIACVDEQASQVPAGRVDPRAGHAAYRAVTTAARHALDGHLQAVVTAPLSKEAMHLAGHHYPGHTELLAELCGAQRFAMLLYLAPGGAVVSPAGLSVVHVTLHMALRNVFANLSVKSIVEKVRLVHGFVRRVANQVPRVGLCALNPHGGESGLFGDEEQLIIEPAARQARAEGIDLIGPLPADTLMVRARDGRLDAVVAMYHDQGHIAMKLLGMHRAVNVTLGLPIVRTSVAHGTAFDVAWQGRAEWTSLLEAVRVALRLVENK